MNTRVSVLTGAVASVAFAIAGTATAGGGGSGCIYGGEMVVEGQQPLVPADAENNAIDPKWLLMLEDKDDSEAAAPPPVIHN